MEGMKWNLKHEAKQNSKIKYLTEHRTWTQINSVDRLSSTFSDFNDVICATLGGGQKLLKHKDFGFRAPGLNSFLCW